MKRSEVKLEDKWKLEDLYESDEKWEADFKSLSARTEETLAYRGKLSDKKQLLECLKLIDELMLKAEWLYGYAHMRKDENVSLGKYVGMSDRAMSLYVALSSAQSFVEPELSALDESVLKKFIADPDFADYSYMLKQVLRVKAHILGEESEKLLAMVSESLGCFRNTFAAIDNVDLPLPKVKDSKGDEIQLTHGTYGALLYGKDKTARKNAFYGMYGAIKSLINTIASNYTGSVKQDNFFARARGFSSPLEQAMYMGDIPAAVYDNLIKHVGENLPVMHEYVEYRKKMLGGEVNMYDMHVSLVDEAELSLDFKDAFELVKKGLAPLGKDYVELLERARKERWMDVYETENKRSGAYQSGCYGMHPFVLLNYSRTTHDIFTIAHELGHAMHSHFSDSALAYSKAGYAIFVAEVASTVNEVLLLKYLLSSTKDVALKKFLLNYYLDMFRTTLFRQTQFAEFEKKAHDMDLNGEALTADSLSDMYYELNKKYYGGAAVHNDEIRYEWARIPHFYNAFYVYKYATGITSAVNIADGILKNPGNVVGYKKFLSAGGSDSPYEILKIAGVDLKTAKPYETAMKEFKDTLAALKKL